MDLGTLAAGALAIVFLVFSWAVEAVQHIGKELQDHFWPIVACFMIWTLGKDVAKSFDKLTNQLRAFREQMEGNLHVLAGGSNPIQHFVQFGWHEKRAPDAFWAADLPSLITASAHTLPSSMTWGRRIHPDR